MPYSDQFLLGRLDTRAAENGLRKLSLPPGLHDFCSNDYLGIVTRDLLQPFFTGHERHGSTGSRTLTGHYSLIEETESVIAGFHRAEAALIFNSGYAANMGVLGCIPQRGDTILFDFLSHASIRDGIRLSYAQSFSFAHNDLNDLESKLKKHATGAERNVFVATETTFSMDGDQAPLAELVELCEKYGAHLVVDEAHAIGVEGEQGEGLAQAQGLGDRLFARVYTYGKGPGAHGAAVTGSHTLKSYLVNFSRPFIYTTAMPPAATQAIQASYGIFPAMRAEREKIKALAGHFHQLVFPFEKQGGNTPIQALIIPGNDAVTQAAKLLQQHGFDVRPIRYPSVPRGRERLRVSLHAFNEPHQLTEMAALLNEAYSVANA
jgi:8-amino-7-oxononanoate synthase